MAGVLADAAAGTAAGVDADAGAVDGGTQATTDSESDESDELLRASIPSCTNKHAHEQACKHPL